MKTIKYLLLVFIIVGFTSCKDEGYVQIDTLSKYGEVFYGGQQIPVWIGVNTNDKEFTTYTWECNGGEFSGPGNRTRILWIAPREKGEYTVTCTVKCGGKTETRSTNMVVREYFFDLFGVASTNFTAANYTVTYANEEVKLVGSKANTRGTYTRIVDDPLLMNPYTLSVDMAWRKAYKNATSSMYWTLYTERPTNSDGTKARKYVRRIRLEMWPTQATVTANNYSLQFETFDALTSQAVNNIMIEGNLPQFVFADGYKAQDGKGMRSLSISLDSDLKTIVKLDNQVVVESDLIKKWAVSQNAPNKIGLNKFEFQSFDKCDMYLDNVVLRPE